MFRTGSTTARLSNNLPADNTGFSNLYSFKRSITLTFLVSYCIVFFSSRPIVILCCQKHSLVDSVLLLWHVSGYDSCHLIIIGII